MKTDNSYMLEYFLNLQKKEKFFENLKINFKFLDNRKIFLKKIDDKKKNKIYYLKKFFVENGDYLMKFYLKLYHNELRKLSLKSFLLIEKKEKATRLLYGLIMDLISIFDNIIDYNSCQLREIDILKHFKNIKIKEVKRKDIENKFLIRLQENVYKRIAELREFIVILLNYLFALRNAFLLKDNPEDLIKYIFLLDGESGILIDKLYPNPEDEIGKLLYNAANQIYFLATIELNRIAGLSKLNRRLSNIKNLNTYTYALYELVIPQIVIYLKFSTLAFLNLNRKEKDIISRILTFKNIFYKKTKILYNGESKTYEYLMKDRIGKAKLSSIILNYYSYIEKIEKKKDYKEISFTNFILEDIGEDVVEYNLGLYVVKDEEEYNFIDDEIFKSLLLIIKQIYCKLKYIYQNILGLDFSNTYSYIEIEEKIRKLTKEQKEKLKMIYQTLINDVRLVYQEYGISEYDIYEDDVVDTLITLKENLDIVVMLDYIVKKVRDIIPDDEVFISYETLYEVIYKFNELLKNENYTTYINNYFF